MTNEELEADLKAEWKNLNATTEALRNLVFALDHSGLDWDCTANAPLGRLDDAMSAARGILVGYTSAKDV
jgi:hypothetical protein